MNRRGNISEEGNGFDEILTRKILQITINHYDLDCCLMESFCCILRIFKNIIYSKERPVGKYTVANKAI